MRFYFQDSGQKIATKCIRVASDATSQAVIETLIEKFRADMRMLSMPEYALYEIHENGGKSLLKMFLCICVNIVKKLLVLCKFCLRMIILRDNVRKH